MGSFQSNLLSLLPSVLLLERKHDVVWYICLSITPKFRRRLWETEKYRGCGENAGFSGFEVNGSVWSVCNYGIKKERRMDGSYLLLIFMAIFSMSWRRADLSLYGKKRTLSLCSQICCASYEIYRPFTFSCVIFIGPIGLVSLNWPWEDRQEVGRETEWGQGCKDRDSMRSKWSKTWRWAGKWTIYWPISFLWDLTLLIVSLLWLVSTVSEFNECWLWFYWFFTGVWYVWLVGGGDERGHRNRA